MDGMDSPIFIDVATQNLINDINQEIQNTDKKKSDKKCREKSPIITEEEATKDCVLIQSRRIKCPECNRYTAENEEKMTRHIRKMHRGENPFQCFMCDYGTYNKVLFEEHVRIHQGIKPFKCSHCSHTSVSKRNLKKHEQIHRPDNPLKCPDCDHIAKHKRGFAFHQKKCHGDDKLKFECEVCHKFYASEKKLKTHQKYMRKCDECDYKTCSKALILIHKAEDHGQDGGELKFDGFKCGLCTWSSNNKPRILLHLIHHPNQVVDESVVDIGILKKHGIMT